jgi:hypothetical protein
MQSLKISSFLERAPLPRARLAPARPRLTAAEAPLVAPADAVAPDDERRILASRRAQDRRASAQSTFLDTRGAQGRRRNPGRRADDQQSPSGRMAISVKA